MKFFEYVLFGILFVFCSNVLAVDYNLPHKKWRLISLPAAPPAAENTVEKTFGDDISGAYGTDWALFEYNSEVNQYHELNKTDPIKQGIGYWIIQLSGNSVTLDLPAGSRPSTPSTALTSSKNQNPQWNLVGSPFPEAHSLSDFSIKVANSDICGDSGCSLGQAKDKQFVHNKVWPYNGQGYEEKGIGDTINPWEGFWIPTLPGSNGYSLSLVAKLAGNHIDRLSASDDGVNLNVKMIGNFIEGSHFSFFIDADNNPDTGYVKRSWNIRGAEYMVQGNGLYQYPDKAQGWSWDRISTDDITMEKTSTQVAVHVPLHLLNVGSVIKYTAEVATNDWTTHTAYAQMLEYRIGSIDNPNGRKVTFTETPKALRNPLKGFMIWSNDVEAPRMYVALNKAIVRWKDIENSENDGVDKIRRYSERYMYKGAYNGINYQTQDRNIKTNPIVILKKRSVDDYSPSDMDISEHDNQTAIFADRVEKLASKLGKAWDNDPHIGFIYMGIVGTWGEQWSTAVSPGVAKALGDSFTQAFKHKKVIVRIPQYFNKTYLESHNNIFRGNKYQNYYNFGMYWDAFAWDREMTGLLDTDDVLATTGIWKNQPILGEVAFNVDYADIYDYHDFSDQGWRMNTKNSIHATLTHEHSLDYLSDYIRDAHCTALSWISLYDESDAGEAEAAQSLQKIMGYRFVLKKANYSSTVSAGGTLDISFNVQNTGSAPFYYDWPVEVSLLDRSSKEVVWSDRFKSVDIRGWKPGDQWDFDNNSYRLAAETHNISERFTLPNNLGTGEYILALSILDPAGMKPAVRFAVTNYYNNGRTPLGMVGVGVNSSSALPDFDDTSDDEKLGY